MSDRVPADPEPSLLVSFVYLKTFGWHRHRYWFRDWAMDSGAWSAHNSGKVIDPGEYKETCLRLIAADPKLTEVFSLDVIGDWRAGARNAEALWAAGVPAVPTYHPGEPWSVLEGLARDYPKVALGGVVGWNAPRKEAWVGQCFARVWPKAVHGLGMGSERMLTRFPFHSADSTTWETAACRFGRWEGYGYLPGAGTTRDLRAQVEFFLGLERRVRGRWAGEMTKVPGYGTAALTCRPGSGLPGVPAPCVRLAVEATSGGSGHKGNRAVLALTPPAHRGTES